MRRIEDRPPRRSQVADRAAAVHEMVGDQEYAKLLRENSGTGRYAAPPGPTRVTEDEWGGACDPCKVTWAWPKDAKRPRGADLLAFRCPECGGKPLRPAHGLAAYVTRRMPRGLMLAGPAALACCPCGAAVPSQGLLCVPCARRRAEGTPMPRASVPLPDYTGPRCVKGDCKNPSSASNELCAPCQRASDAAPCIFGVGRGYAARQQAWQQWVDEHGHWDASARAHPWMAQETAAVAFGTAPGGSARCVPVLLVAGLGCRHGRDEVCFCVGGDLVYRGACFGCDWEGPIRGEEQENAAVEDAHDHSWPGWRDLPVVDQPAFDANKAKLAAWRAQVDRVYPPGWRERGGPFRTHRQPFATRHHTAGTESGFDLGDVLDTEPPLVGVYRQDSYDRSHVQWQAHCRQAWDKVGCAFVWTAFPSTRQDAEAAASEHARTVHGFTGDPTVGALR